jgi:hypothetical protein
MIPSLQHPSRTHNENNISPLNRCQPMRHSYNRAPSLPIPFTHGSALYSFLHQAFRLTIQITGRFI